MTRYGHIVGMALLTALFINGSFETKGWCTGAQTYVMERDTNRFGEDYKDMDLASPAPRLCAEACLRETRCKAWTYVKPGVQGEKAKCWLKDKVPPPAPDENCVSGVKGKRSVAGGNVTPSAGSSGTGTQTYAMERDTNRFGEDYKDMDLASPEPRLCAEACLREAKCKAWTYVKPGVQGEKAKCWLKDKVPSPAPDENCVSGVKKKLRSR